MTEKKYFYHTAQWDSENQVSSGCFKTFVQVLYKDKLNKELRKKKKTQKIIEHFTEVHFHLFVNINLDI